MEVEYTIELPDGVERYVSGEIVEGESLLAFLKKKGVDLNSRCGGQGRCKGCQVVIGDTENLVRSCGTATSNVRSGEVIKIPSRSFHDQSLSGITEFTILGDLDLDTNSQGFAVAIDIGTTTVAAALWDLSAGKCLSCRSRANAQIPFGDNVISRIQFSLDVDDGLQQLGTAIWKGTIQPLLVDLCGQHNLRVEQLEQIAVAGNPVMLHTLSGDKLTGFGKYPFCVEYLGAKSLTSKSSDIGVDGLQVSLLPSLGPFVGADITAGIIASDLDQMTGNLLLIDFGTNGEIFLKTNDGSFATATAAGPAFEGGSLNCGATAKKGVVSSLKYSHGSWDLKLVGDAKRATGISGAAYIEWIGEAMENGLLNSFGRFDKSRLEVTESVVDGKNELRIYISDDLFVSEIDVAEIMQAKAAISAGVLTLLDRAGIEADALDRIYIAGGFGYYMNLIKAQKIGLLPELEGEMFEPIGNASLAGASLYLLNTDTAKRMDRFVAQVEVIELNNEACFEDYYTDSLMLENPY